MSEPLLISALLFGSLVLFCLCKHCILPWCRTAKRREILSKNKYNKLTAEPAANEVATYGDDEDDDDADVSIDVDNQMILKRVEYTSKELEQLKLLDAAIDNTDEELMDSDSLNFPENDALNTTDNDEFVSLEETTLTSSVLNNATRTQDHQGAHASASNIAHNDGEHDIDTKAKKS